MFQNSCTESRAVLRENMLAFLEWTVPFHIDKLCSNARKKMFLSHLWRNSRHWFRFDLIIFSVNLVCFHWLSTAFWQFWRIQSYFLHTFPSGLIIQRYSGAVKSGYQVFWLIDRRYSALFCFRTVTVGWVSLNFL